MLPCRSMYGVLRTSTSTQKDSTAYPARRLRTRSCSPRTEIQFRNMSRGRAHLVLSCSHTRTPRIHTLYGVLVRSTVIRTPYSVYTSDKHTKYDSTVWSTSATGSGSCQSQEERESAREREGEGCERRTWGPPWIQHPLSPHCIRCVSRGSQRWMRGVWSTGNAGTHAEDVLRSVASSSYEYV